MQLIKKIKMSNLIIELKNLVIDSGMTYDDIGHVIDRPACRVSQILNPKPNVNVRLDVFQSVCKAIGVEINLVKKE